VPPRHAYWTILIDDKPTAFRARDREELQPTFVQLQRKNANVTMRWFARGKLWDSREAEHDDFQRQKQAAGAPRDRRDRPQGAERRGSDWRPGGTHKDPRDRFKKKNRPERAWSEKDPETQRDRDKPAYAVKPRGDWRDRPVEQRSSADRKPNDDGRERKPLDHRSSPDRRPGGGGWSGKPSGPPRDRKPWQNKPWQNTPPVPTDRPWQTKPSGPRAQRKPWAGPPGGSGQSAGFKPRGDKPPSHGFESRRGPQDSRATGREPWTKPSGEKRPWSNRPPSQGSGDARRNSPNNRASGGGPPGEKRPFGPRTSPEGKPSGRGWSGKPSGPPRGDRPWTPKPAGEKPFDRRSSPDRKPGAGGWQKKPFRPNGPAQADRPRGPRRDFPDQAHGDRTRKRRDDEPPDRD
jgi:23S rRNA pseudouridine2605 synthase